MARRAPIERFMEKVEVDNNGCWIWTASVVADGYGQFRTGATGSKMARAHRFAYEHFVGPIPEGLTIDHLCRVRRCCNPAHLEPVPIEENTRRSPLALATINSAKTECKRGHPLSGDNLRVTSEGRRVCRTCDKANRDAWNAAHPNYHRDYSREWARNRRAERRSTQPADV